MFKFVHVWGIGESGPLGIFEERWERGYVERARKKIGSGGVGFFNLAKSGHEKNLPGLFDRLTAAGI